MSENTTIQKPNGKLGILTPGMGAVATTFMAGVLSIRKGFSEPIGSLTQMGTIRLGKRTEKKNPLIKDFIPLASLDDIVLGGWDIFEDNALGVTSMRKARPTYLRELYGCSSISMAEEIFNENKVTYQNSPYYFIDSYAFFMEKGHYKFAKQIADKAIKKVERNPMLLKAWGF